MPLKRILGTKDILTDLRRINTGAGLGQGSVKPHDLLGPKHQDTAANAPSQGAMILGDSTSEWNILLHPAAAGYALVTDATTVAWDQTPSWTGLHTFGAGWVITNAGGTGDLDGNDLLIDQDGDSYLHASADDVIDLVLAGASGEFGITINGAEDFTITANALNVLAGTAFNLSEYMYHLGDADTFWRYQDDQINVQAGGVDFLSIVEGATDYIRFNDGGADVDFEVEASGVADALQVNGANGRVTVGTLIYGHVKSVTAAGELGNGPVEAGEVTGLGGTTVIAPSSRLYASTTVK